MQNSQLFHVLPLLSSKEYSELGKFLASPYCNSVERLVEYHEALKKFHPHLHDMKLTPEELFKRVFPEGKPFNAGELRGLTSKFHKAVNEFLAFNELKQNEVLKAKLTTLSLSQKDNYSLFVEKAEAFIKQLLEKKERDLAHYLDLFEMNRHLFFHPLTEKRKDGAEFFQQTVGSLDRFFTLAKLRLAAEHFIRSGDNGVQSEIAYLEEAIKQAAIYSEGNPVFGIYLKIIQLYQGKGNDQLFQQLRAEFRQHGNLLRADERNEIYPFVMSYAIRQGNQGNKKYQQEQFEIYKDWLQSGLLIEHNHFPEGIFRQIVSIAIFQGEFDWAEKFMSDYQRFLPPHYREIELNIGKAEILFYKGKFSECVDFLNQFKTNNPIVELWLRRRTIQCLYEDYCANATLLDALEARIDAFDKYLQRDKILQKSLVEAHRKFCSLTKKLANGKNLERREKLALAKRLKEELAEPKTIAGREWLEAKIQAI